VPGFTPAQACRFKRFPKAGREKPFPVSPPP
jgi:hypothetical protein